jgi:hypothetical protein
LRSITPRVFASGRVEAGSTGAPAEPITRSWSRLAGVAAGAAGALIALGAVSWPLVFSSAAFNNDWLNHLWYMWHQSVAIREGHAPSLFLDYSGGILYPIYAFYGGTLYALVGALSLVPGDDPLRAYVLSYLLGFAAAYGGWYWIARMLGVRGWLAHIPGLVFITSASYLTMIYALGDWPEFLAVSVMPLMIAAGLSVLRAPRLRFGPAIALIASSVVFFGSHLLTMIWGSTILVVVIVAILLGAPGARRGVTRVGVLRVAALVIPAAMVSAWFLLPTVAYEAHTFVAHAYPHARALLRELMYTVAARNLFNLSRAPPAGSIVSLSLPILAVAWVLVSIAMLAWRRRTGTWMRVLLIIATGTVAITVVMTHAGLILVLPRAYATLQFSFRLESFVLLGLSGAIVVVLVIARDKDARLRRWTWLLAPVAAVSVIGAAQQTSAHPQGKDRSTALVYLTPPPERFGQFDYLDNRLREYEEPSSLVYFPVAAGPNRRVSEVVRVPPDRLVATNIRGGPDLVNVTGATIVGVDPHLDDVLELAPSSLSNGASASSLHATPPTATISVGPAEPLPVVAGRAISLIALAVLAIELGLIAVRDVYERSSRSSTRAPRE